MGDFFVVVFGILAFVAIIFIEWKIGAAVGKSITKGFGLIVGIILIFIGFTLPAGLAIIMHSSKNESKSPPLNLPAGNFNFNMNKPYETSYSQNRYDVYSKFIGKNYKDILLENGLSEYITLFEKNKLIDISIISSLNENDWEKLGITIMGDRKLIMKIFSVK